MWWRADLLVVAEAQRVMADLLVVAEAERVVDLLVVGVDVRGDEEVVQRVQVVPVIVVQQAAVDEHLELQVVAQQHHNTVVLQRLHHTPHTHSITMP